MFEYLNIIGFFSGQKCRVLLYLRAVPPTGSHSDILIIPGNLPGLVIIAEPCKISTFSHLKKSFICDGILAGIHSRQRSNYFSTKFTLM